MPTNPAVEALRKEKPGLDPRKFRDPGVTAKGEHVNPAAGRRDVQVAVAEREASAVGTAAQGLGEGADGPHGGKVLGEVQHQRRRGSAPR